jgi:hypothetical protein
VALRKVTITVVVTSRIPGFQISETKMVAQQQRSTEQTLEGGRRAADEGKAPCAYIAAPSPRS